MKNNSFLLVLFALVEIALVVGGIMVLLTAPDLAVVGVGIIVFAGIFLILMIAKYNQMVRYRNKVKEGFALIDVHLKLRFDLIPNLVATVKGYAKHEKELLEEVIKLRQQATEAHDEKERIEYGNKIMPYMKSLIAVAEGYPELKASALYTNLMEQLVDVEDRIVSARRIYDSNVNMYNTLIEVFPSNLIASAFGFKREELFRIETGEKIVPSVNL
jgi:LemA protein